MAGRRTDSGGDHCGDNHCCGKASGQVYAFSNTCPHAGGPLSESSLEVGEDNVIVRCPYHGWDFDLKDGACLTSPELMSDVTRHI